MSIEYTAIIVAVVSWLLVVAGGYGQRVTDRKIFMVIIATGITPLVIIGVVAGAAVAWQIQSGGIAGGLVFVLICGLCLLAIYLGDLLGGKYVRRREAL